MDKHIPLFSCGGCMDDYSWPAENLRVHKKDLWCEICWDHAGDMKSWGDLDEFIPDDKKEIARLRDALENECRCDTRETDEEDQRCLPCRALNRKE